jgi:hypothetical protein
MMFEDVEQSLAESSDRSTYSNTHRRLLRDKAGQQRRRASGGTAGEPLRVDRDQPGHHPRGEGLPAGERVREGRALHRVGLRLGQAQIQGADETDTGDCGDSDGEAADGGGCGERGTGGWTPVPGPLDLGLDLGQDLGLDLGLGLRAGRGR